MQSNDDLKPQNALLKMLPHQTFLCAEEFCIG